MASCFDGGVLLSEFYDGLSGFMDGLSSLFAFLPVDWSYILSRALTLVVAWIIISLALKIVKIFF